MVHAVSARLGFMHPLSTGMSNNVWITLGEKSLLSGNIANGKVVKLHEGLELLFVLTWSCVFLLHFILLWFQVADLKANCISLPFLPFICRWGGCNVRWMSLRSCLVATTEECLVLSLLPLWLWSVGIPSGPEVLLWGQFWPPHECKDCLPNPQWHTQTVSAVSWNNDTINRN